MSLIKRYLEENGYFEKIRKKHKGEAVHDFAQEDGEEAVAEA
jgi:hypothetical protein